MNRPSPVRAPAALLVLALAGCSFHAKHPEPEVATPPRAAVSYGTQKQAMVTRMEDAMNEMMRRYQSRITEIRGRLDAELAALRPPARLQTVERALRGFGAPDEERFDAEVDRKVEAATAELVKIVGRDHAPGHPAVVGTAEDEAWATAAAIGGQGQGAGYGFVSGVQEVDERAQVTIELLKSHADVEGMRAVGALRKAEIHEMSESFRHDLATDEAAGAAPKACADLLPNTTDRGAILGRFLLFQTEVQDGFRARGQDTIGAVVVFENNRLPLAHDYRLLQARRSRVVRSGMVVKDFGWARDPGTPGGTGDLPRRGEVVDPRILASEPFYPAVNVDHALFDQLRDFTVIYDYKTALFDATTGETLGAMSWQLTWITSATGEVRQLPPVSPAFDAAASPLVARVFLGAEAAGGSGAEPFPSDRMPSLTDVMRPAFDVPARDAATGEPKSGGVQFVRPMGTDHVAVTAAGRSYLARHRLQILTADMSLFSYLDGVRGRYVLHITDVTPGSVVKDLGFRRGDDVISINGAEIKGALDLWTFFNESPRATHYEIDILRAGAQRRLVFEVEGAPADWGDDGDGTEGFTDVMIDRLRSLLQPLSASVEHE